ncbi:GGDEF domain-containing protein [Catenovulum maritimum]|nr:GGDEF domain-containing protein [Catenovulum maritimum]
MKNKSTKTIALLLTELTRNNNCRIFAELKKEATKQKVNLITFEGRTLQSKSYADKQRNFAYQLINKARVDHIITTSAAVPDSLTSKQFDNFFNGKTEQLIINYYLKRPKQHSIRVNNSTGSAQLVEHLVNHHKYEKFIVIRGPVRDANANQRFATTISSLEKYNITPVELQATWDSQASIQVIKNIIKDYPDYQAVIFPNDETAIAALDYINNFKPEFKGRFAIVGFDNSENAKNISPQLTTVDHPHAAMAQKALELINTQPSEYVDAIFNTTAVFRGSCGCHGHIEDTCPTQRLFTGNYNIEENIQALSHDEYFEKLSIALSERDILSCSICLYQSEPFKLEATTEVPQVSKLAFQYYNGTRQTEYENQAFDTALILPDDVYQQKQPQCLLVKNLFYNDAHFGYVVFDLCQGRIQDIEDLIVNISTTLNIIYLFEKMQSALKENERLVASLAKDNTNLKAISATDEMTELLNRRGFYQAICQRIENTELTEFSLIYADMDKLKYVNDTFGHQAGDLAIEKMANVLKSVFRATDIICRIGGDEFVICAFIADENIVQQMTQRVNSELAKLTDLEFKISMSFGIYLCKLSEDFDLENAIKQADKKLYQQKQLKKHGLIL